MEFDRWFRAWLGQPRTRQLSRPQSPRRAHVHLHLEHLEPRALPSNFSAATVSDLIADINAANQSGGTNTITLTSPTNSPYTLIARDNMTDGGNGLPVISKKDKLTILGNGDTIERSTAAGTPAFRLFNVASGGSLTLVNLTLKNGLAFGSGNSAEGGAIYNEGGLVLSGGAIQDNSAAGTSDRNAHDGAGGGIWSNGSLTVENGTLFMNNLARGGNATVVRGSGGNGFGGGLVVAGGTANLSGVALANNTALAGTGGDGTGPGGDAYGGALYVVAGTVNLSGDALSGNQALGGFGWHSDANGGAIYVAGGTLTLVSSMFDANGAYAQNGNAYGGGLCIAGGIATLYNDALQSNSATGFFDASGGGIYTIAATATVYLDSSTMTNTSNNGFWIQVTGSIGISNIVGSYILQDCP